jgi:hypothetical protein
MVWKGMLAYTPEQANLVNMSKQTMIKYLEKPHLVEGFLPSFAVGCRRTTPVSGFILIYAQLTYDEGISFMKSLQEPNVDVHFTAVEQITETGITGADGREVSGIDTIVCATGFDTSFRPHFPIIGQKNVSLADLFTPNPDSYFGLSCPGKLSPLM